MLTGTFEADGAILLRITPDHPKYEAVAAEVARGKKEACKEKPPVALSAAEQGDAYKELAEFYANLFTTLYDGLPDEAELAAVDDELKNGDWVLAYEHGVWTVLQGDGGIEMSQPRAPKGGIEINGKRYAGGQWIPREHAASMRADPEIARRMDEAESARIGKRKAKGVDVEALRARLGAHQQALTGADLRSANAKFHALKRQHGELTLHRLSELEGKVSKAYENADEAHKPYWAKELAKLHHAVEMAHQSDKLHGGLADAKTPADFEPQALAKGAQVEREHTDDPATAREIAMDHLTEDGKYYDKLAQMEKSDATQEGQQSQGREPEHQDRDEGGQAAEAGGGHRAQEGGQEPQEVASLASRAKALYEGAKEKDFDYKSVDEFVNELGKASKDEVNGVLEALGYSRQGSKSKALEKVWTLIKNRRENRDRVNFNEGMSEKSKQLQDEMVKAQEEARAGRESEPKPEPKPVPKAEDKPLAAPPEKRINISGQGAGSVPVKQHVEKLKALYDDYKNTDFKALDAALNEIGNDLTSEGAKELARGFGMKGRWKNRQELMEDIRSRIANRREAHVVHAGIAKHAAPVKPSEPVGHGTPLESIHEKRLKHARSALSQVDLRERIKDAASETAEPTPEQKEAGNYKKGKVTISGLPITIENAKGSTRSGKAKDGTEWSVTMPHHYGYIRRTESEADGDHVDVFIGPEPESEIVFIVDQLTAGGRFDEHKVMLGFTNADDAKKGYLDAYSEGWTGFGGMKTMLLDDFKDWLENGDTGKRVSLSSAPVQDDAINAARILVRDYLARHAG